MRSYGKNAQGQWVQVTQTDYIWLATLIQTLRLNQNESPVYGNYGIPAVQSIQTQIAPDAALNRTQNQFSQYFSSLVISRVPNLTEPTYNVRVVFLSGVTLTQIVS